MPGDRTEVLKAGEPLPLTTFFFEFSECGELLFLRPELEPAGEWEVFCPISLHLAIKHHNSQSS